MIRNIIASYVGLPFSDIVKGLNARKYYKFYRTTLRWDRSTIERFQFQKLKSLLEHAYKNVPFYTNRFRKINITPDSIKTFEDLKIIPYLTRTDLKNNLENLISKESSKKKLIRCSSSGTTGIPISYYKDNCARSADMAALFFSWSICGWKLGDKRIHIWGNPESIKNWNKLSSKIKIKFFSTRNFPSFLLNSDKNFLKLIDLINIYKPDYIEGYTSSIYMLSRFLSEKKIRVHLPRRILTTAENLYDYQRYIMERVFSPVTDYYGFGEINGVAVQCEKENYHIIEPRVYLEEDNHPSGGKKIVATDLENFGMPLIRYEVGDLFDGIKNTMCICGLKFKYFEKLDGRVTEIVKLPNGKTISPLTIFGGTAFRKVNNFIRHQTIWNGRYFIFVFEVNSSFSEIDKKNLKSILRNILKPFDVDFRLRITKGPTSFSDKYSYFKVDHTID